MIAIVLAVVAIGIAFGGVAWLWGQLDSLQFHVRRLERELAELRDRPVVANPTPPPPSLSAPAEVPAAVPVPPAKPPAAPVPPKLRAPLPPPRPTPAPRPPLNLPSIERVAAIFAALLGGLTLLLGFVLFVGVALSRGWVGPGARMLAAFTVTGTVWVAGDLLRKRSPWVGSTLAGAGFVGVLSALYATHSVYDFLGGTPTTIAMVVTCAVAGLSAVRHDDRVAGHLSLLGALLTPVLLATGEDKSVSFFIYLALVTTGTVATSAVKGWADLLLAAAFGTGLLYLGWTASWFSADHAPVALLGLLGLSVPYLVTALVGRGYARHAAVVVLAGWPVLLASTWLTPIDPMFTDTHTAVTVWRPLPALAMLQIALLPLLSAPLWLVGRVRKSPWLSGLGTLVATGHAALWYTLWGTAALLTPAPHAEAVPWLVGGLWLLAVPTAMHLAGKPASHGVAPLPLVGGTALAAAFTLHTWTTDGGPSDGLVVAILTGAMLAITGLLMRPRGTAPALPFAAVGAGLFLLLASLARLPQFGLPWLGAGLFGVDNPLASLDAWYQWRVPAWGPALIALAAFAIVPLGVRWSEDERRLALSGAALAPLALGPALVAQWLMSVGRPGVGVVPLVLGSVAALGATASVRLHGSTRAQFTPAAFLLVALAGVNMAVPLELRDGWLSVALSLELIAVAVLARRFTHPVVRLIAIPLAIAVGVRLLVNPYALSYAIGGWPIFNWTLYTWGVPTLAVATAAVAYRHTWEGLPTGQRLPGESWAPTLLGLLACALGFAFVNVEVSHAFQPDTALTLFGQGLLQGMTRSLSWGAYGMFVLVLGWLGHSRWLRLVGFAGVLLATAKVFLVDLWALSGFVRVGSLLGLGVFLIIAALLFERLVLRESEPAKEAP